MDKYCPPRNIEFLSAPKINKPVWGNLSDGAKIIDHGFQSIQRDFLLSAVPTLQVMEKINASQDDLNQLDVKELIRTLTDSLAFIGSANDGLEKEGNFLQHESSLPGHC